LPLAGTVTFHSTPAPVAASPLANPLPVKPAWLLSIDPSTAQKPVVFSSMRISEMPPSQGAA
jgi:hypothetical protein